MGQIQTHKESALYATFDTHRETDRKTENRYKYLEFAFGKCYMNHKWDISFNIPRVSEPSSSDFTIRGLQNAKTSKGCAEGLGCPTKLDLQITGQIIL